MRRRGRLKCLIMSAALAVSSVCFNASTAFAGYDNSVAAEDELGDAVVIEETSTEDGYSLAETSSQVEDADVEEREYIEDDGMISDEGDIVDASSASISTDQTSVALSYSNPYRAFENYVTKSGNKAKLLFENTLYSYDIATGKFVSEYTFPIAVYNSSGRYWSSQSNMNAYIREDAGLLYYGYNSYTNTAHADEIANIIVYDLEKGTVKTTFSIDACMFRCVGADKKGNIYVCTETASEAYELGVYSSNGTLLTKMALDNEINCFSGFCEDGTFYYVDEYMVYSAYGYPNLMGRLMNGKFSANKITLNTTYMTYAKNIYFGDYRNPVEILNDKYLVTWNGGFYPLDKITDSSWSCDLSVSKNLTMGSEYEYIYNIGVNSVIIGNMVYTLYDNDTIYVYDITTGQKVKFLNTDNKIVNLKKCGSDLLALETEGTNFFYKKIKLNGFSTINTTTYNMNNFSVYKGRTKNQIVDKFIAAAPQNYSASLFSSVGKVTSPYKEYKLSTETQNNAVNVSNYYRWLAGLTTFESSDSTVWTNAGKGAVLLQASEFSHYPSQPDDMDDAFYSAAKGATSSSSIAMNYASGQKKLIYTIRQFMNDTSYTMPGHRNTFLTRNGSKIAYGMTEYYLCQTVEYDSNPNPQGTAVVNNNEAAYAWPSAGYFPAEDLSTSAYWTVNLNTDKLNLSNVGLEVTITDLDTGEVFTRKNSVDGLYATIYWGKYISFKPPTVSGSSYAGKRYKVTLTNLEDAEGMPAKLEYTVEFFSYGDVTRTINGEKYACDAYGSLVKVTDTGANGGSTGGTTGGSSGGTTGDLSSEEQAQLPAINVSYRTHIQSFGWEGTSNPATWKMNGAMSGTSGIAKRLEGINIIVNSAETGKTVDLGIQYTTHCQSYGWLPWSANGDMNGTEGEAKRLEAIKIQLTGKHANYYDVYYRVHAQSYGWLGWAKNGEPAGTAGYAKRLEGIQILVVKKGTGINQNVGNIISARSEAYVASAGTSPVVGGTVTDNKNPVIPGADVPNVAYKTHVQTYGWQGWKYNGAVSGTVGQSKRLEGIDIKLTNAPYSGSIAYTTHVQSYGWQENVNNSSTWKKDGEMSGTSGKAKRLEAICITLTGEMAEHYDVYYRVHAQSYGWLGWAKNGAPAGTAGYSKRLEGIQIVLVPKNGQAPANNYGGVTSANANAYIER